MVSSLLDSCWPSRRNVFLFDACTTRPRCFHCKLRQHFLYIKFESWTSIHLRFNAISLVLLSSFLPSSRTFLVAACSIANVSCFDAELSRRRKFFPRRSETIHRKRRNNDDERRRDWSALECRRREREREGERVSLNFFTQKHAANAGSFAGRKQRDETRPRFDSLRFGYERE